ncbi:thiamine phosphate synthase [Acinetobacter sp. GXMZU3951]
MSKPNIHVAIALLFHQAKVLVGWRSATQHQGNKHEFPGGKVEQNETPLEACRREVFEEVGVGLNDWHAFDVICHEYDDVVVNLHLFHAAVPEALLNEIQQPWTWYSRSELLNLNFPKANFAILQRLYWPNQIKISEHLAELQQLKPQQLMYWRVEHQAADLEKLEQLPAELAANLIINWQAWQQLTQPLQKRLAAVHLKQHQLMALKSGELPVGVRFIAACHDLVAMQHAQKIGCDAIFLSPVLATATHPEVSPLGWTRFKEYAQQVDIPVFALGGMRAEALQEAQSHHAYGIAGIRFI